MPESHPTISSMGERLGPAIERQFDTICRMLLKGPTLTLEPGYLRIITGAPHPLGSFAVISDAKDPHQTRAAVGPLCKIASPSAAIFMGALSREVESCVGERGFALAETMPAMAVDLDRLALPDLPAGYRFDRIDPEKDRDAWNEAMAVGYEIPREVAELFLPPPPLTVSGGASIYYFAVSRGDTYIATSTLFLEGGLAGIYCVSTHPEHRGKGLGAYATAEPLRLAREQGYRTGILQSSAMGESVYRRLGFRQYGSLPLYVRMPG